MSRDKPVNSTPPGGGCFATTHWSMVLAAGHSSSPRHEPALSELCQTYWFPLYAYLRRRGYDAHEAADYTQAFFAQMLDKDYLKKVKPKPGKFRSFLLTALKNFVANERARAAAKKRGGGRAVLSLDFENAETQYALEPSDDLSPAFHERRRPFDRCLNHLPHKFDRFDQGRSLR